MNKKLRLRILTKLAQTQPAQPTETPAILGPVPSVQGDLFTYVNNSYNLNTVNQLKELTEMLNEALHLASQGKDNFNNIITNNSKLSGAGPDHKNVGLVSKRLFNSFLNNKNAFNQFSDGKVPADTIHNWSNALLSSTEFGALSQVKPTGPLGRKYGDLKTEIKNILTNITNQNPKTA